MIQLDGWAISASLDSAAPMKPTGMPMTAAGRGAPSSIISSSRNSAVGALPTATTAPSIRSRHSSIAAALRVVPMRAASSGTDGSASVHSTSLPAGSRLRVTPLATMLASHRIGAPARSAARPFATTSGVKARSRTRSTMPQAWIIRTATWLTSAGRPARSASARMVAKDWR